ncbi:hypothetical protein T12_5286 [Trichinella patagoniensis]|uniref:Uncharacterized protein n=1 Tax=Trichinella patagoniensis TaxID=990121 RepID=A0A0V0ZJ26_9BILA|nr:hypothetical protein T12_5286 [Trichinella patagoniensis]
MSCDVCLCLGVSLSLKLFGSFPTRQQINGNAALLLEQRTAELSVAFILHSPNTYFIIYHFVACAALLNFIFHSHRRGQMRSLSIFTGQHFAAKFCLFGTFLCTSRLLVDSQSAYVSPPKPQIVALLLNCTFKVCFALCLRKTDKKCPFNIYSIATHHSSVFFSYVSFQNFPVVCLIDDCSPPFQLLFLYLIPSFSYSIISSLCFTETEAFILHMSIVLPTENKQAIKYYKYSTTTTTTTTTTTIIIATVIKCFVVLNSQCKK